MTKYHAAESRRLDAAGYVSARERPRCGNCINEIKRGKQGSYCTKYRAFISVSGWCIEFERKPEDQIRRGRL